MSSLILVLLPVGLFVLDPTLAAPLIGVVAAIALVLLFSGTTAPGPAPRVVAALLHNPTGAPAVFTLTLGEETVTLEPGKPWTKVDAFKWVTRGLIEPPQSYHVLPDGTVEINGEKFKLTDGEALARLAQEINKRHAAAPKPAAPRTQAAAATAPAPTHVVFHVKLDHLGHLLIQGQRGSETAETGMRGLPNLIQNGFLLPPRSVHVDPLQRALDLDDIRFPCTAEGAARLEEYLNANYAPALQDDTELKIHVHESPASPTGFDITFVARLSGQRTEVKGHLHQDKLDLLQDSLHCDLLQPGVILRLTPPHLLFRRKQPDTSEAVIAELPDVQYRRITAAELQRMLNHPAIRRSAANVNPAAPTQAAAPVGDPRFERIRVTRNPSNRALLWMELHPHGGAPHGKAFTHHNVAELQHHHAFQPGFEVALSLDNHRLSILNRETHHDESLHLASDSDEATLERAGQLLTAVLRPL